MYVCMYVCMYACMHACMHESMHVYMYVENRFLIKAATINTSNALELADSYFFPNFYAIISFL